MLDNSSNDKVIHVNNTFTELFHLLKQKNHYNDAFCHDDRLCDLNILIEHSENAVTGILHGLQAIGSFVATSQQVDINDVTQLGCFLSFMANLMDALNMLRSDLEFRLCENEKMATIIHN